MRATERISLLRVLASGGATPEEMNMIFRALAVATVVAAYAAPAMADEYYVVRDTRTQKCTVVTERPRDTTLVQVGPLAFKTRDEADRQVTTICTTK